MGAASTQTPNRGVVGWRPELQGHVAYQALLGTSELDA
jgi:hypothetical protein